MDFPAAALVEYTSFWLLRDFGWLSLANQERTPRREHQQRTSPRPARVRRPYRHRHAGPPAAPQEERPARRHLPDRPQHQLHQFLHRILLVLRLLPPHGGQGRLHPVVCRDLPQDRRDAGARRQRRAAAGRPASRSGDRLLRKSSALDQRALPDRASALLLRAGNSLYRRSQRALGGGHHSPPDGCRSGLHSRRWRRNPR